MEPQNTHQTEEAMELWIQHRFSLTGAAEMHRSNFRNIFRTYIGEIREEFKIDPVTDHLAVLDPQEADSPTCREWIESRMLTRFADYLSARNEQHGSAFAEAFARQCGIGESAERAAKEAYRELSRIPRTAPGNLSLAGAYDSEAFAALVANNLAWEDAHDTCLRLGHSEAYAKRCADNLLDMMPTFELPKAHAITSKYFADFGLGTDRGYSEIRAAIFAEYQGPEWDYRPLVAELISRIIEEQIGAGRALDAARRFAYYYVDYIDAHGSINLEDEEYDRDCATVSAEANCRFRPAKDGEKDAFIRLFESVAAEVSSPSVPATGTSFDEVEQKLRGSYFLSEHSEFAPRLCWVKMKTDEPARLPHSPKMTPSETARDHAAEPSKEKCSIHSKIREGLDFNDDESTNGICDNCDLPLEECECEIPCQKCEDARPRDHKCADDPTHCEFCDSPIEDCHCQPSDHYD